MQLAAKKSPNPVTSQNADNYAWFATAVYFNDIWGIRPRARRDTAVSDDGPTGDDVTWVDNDVVSDDDPNLLRYDLDATTPILSPFYTTTTVSLTNTAEPTRL